MKVSEFIVFSSSRTEIQPRCRKCFSSTMSRHGQNVPGTTPWVFRIDKKWGRDLTASGDVIGWYRLWSAAWL